MKPGDSKRFSGVIKVIAGDRKRLIGVIRRYGTIWIRTEITKII